MFLTKVYVYNSLKKKWVTQTKIDKECPFIKYKHKIYVQVAITRLLLVMIQKILDLAKMKIHLNSLKKQS